VTLMNMVKCFQARIITPSSSSSRGVTRRAIQNKTPRAVVCYTPQQSFERSLAVLSDSTPIRGRFTGTTTVVSGTPLALFLIQPANLGSRVASIASDFLRFRVKWIRIRFLGTPVGTTTAGFTSMGILDDVNYAGEPPTTVSGVSELRCAATTFTNETVPTTIEFRPLDKKRWYYCTSSSNDRFDSVGTLFAASNASTAFAYEVDYCIVFSGAATAGAL